MQHISNYMLKVIISAYGSGIGLDLHVVHNIAHALNTMCGLVDCIPIGKGIRHALKGDGAAINGDINSRV